MFFNQLLSGSSSTTGLDSSIFDFIVEGLTKFAGLFLVFPFNVFMGLGIAVVILGFIKIFTRKK